MATLVKFVKDKDGDFKGEITAVFPQLKYNKGLYGNRMLIGYSHIGQHTGVNKAWVNAGTIPANESEYRALKCELESIGYNLKIIGNGN